MSGSEETRRRVREAAAALFAARGFHATTLRDIAAHAGVNLASAHYHFGSKRELYLEVLRFYFAEVRQVLASRGALQPPEVVARLGRDALIALLQARAQAMLDMLLGPPPAVHGTLMQREMLDPSEALPAIVAEFITPMVEELEGIIAPLAPSLDAAQLRICAHGIVGQAMFYRTVMPAILHQMRRDTYPRGFSSTVAQQLTAFSVGGLAALEAQAKPKRPRSRPRRAAK